jgi:tRNA A-37 threonylcarbamoyl transferase component Bud32
MGAPFGNLGNPLARLRGLSRNDSFGDGGASSADDAVRVDVGDGDGGGGRGGALAVPTTAKRGVAMRRRAPTTAERQEHRRLRDSSGSGGGGDGGGGGASGGREDSSARRRRRRQQKRRLHEQREQQEVTFWTVQFKYLPLELEYRLHHARHAQRAVGRFYSMGAYLSAALLCYEFYLDSRSGQAALPPLVGRPILWTGAILAVFAGALALRRCVLRRAAAAAPGRSPSAAAAAARWRSFLSWLSVGATVAVGACALGRATYAARSGSQYHFEVGFAFVFAVALAATALGLQCAHFVAAASALLAAHLLLGYGVVQLAAPPFALAGSLRSNFALWSAFTVLVFGALNRDLVINSRQAFLRKRKLAAREADVKLRVGRNPLARRIASFWTRGAGPQSVLAALGSNSVNWIIAPEDLTLGRKIAAGGSGEIYEGVYNGRPVAVKEVFAQMIDTDNVDDFCHECSILATLSHPLVVTFYGVSYDAAEGTLLIVTELMPLNLAELLADSRRDFPRLDPAVFAHLATQIAAGVHHLHTKGLVHRDLKPENILLTKELGVKLCDFGMSAKRQRLRDLAQQRREAAARSRAGTLGGGAAAADSAGQMFLGTPAYTAPELFGSAAVELAQSAAAAHRLNAEDALRRQQEFGGGGAEAGAEAGGGAMAGAGVSMAPFLHMRQEEEHKEEEEKEKEEEEEGEEEDQEEEEEQEDQEESTQSPPTSRVGPLMSR